MSDAILHTPEPAQTDDWRRRWHRVVFEAQTPTGRAFDVLILVCIVVSVLAVALESVDSVAARYGTALKVLEWALTIFFTVEYILRLFLVHKPTAYARSFFGVVDLLAILPTYISLFFTGTQALVVIRALRLLRIFRIFKAARYVHELNALTLAFHRTRAKILVFIFVVLCAVLIMGTLLYVIEGADSGFTSIPRSVYWAIVTMTTVGYGDIAPQTAPGQFLAAMAMVFGYGLIIIPTGLFAVEFAQTAKAVSSHHCRHCAREGHEADAVYCKYCGEELNPHEVQADADNLDDS